MPVISADPLDRILSLSSAEFVAPGVEAAAERERAEENLTFALEAAMSPEKPKILAEGDSWFAYPRQYFIYGAPANVIQHLRKHKEFVIQNTSSNGDEAVAMMSGAAKIEMLERLRETDYALLLFSGGGNDIVGAFDMDFFLLKKTAGMKALDCIDKTRYMRRLNQVANAYDDLMDLVRDFSRNPDLQVVTHTYDYVIPGKKGASFFGGIYKYDDGRSWMYPFLMAKGIVEAADQREIARWMLDGFREMLTKTAEKHAGRLHVVNTQGTLAESDWLNEIHPTPDGFGKISAKIYREIQELLQVQPNMAAAKAAMPAAKLKARKKTEGKGKSSKPSRSSRTNS
jgi:hypothetical protein